MLFVPRPIIPNPIMDVSSTAIPARQLPRPGRGGARSPAVGASLSPWLVAVTRAARWWPDDERGDAVRGEAVAVDMDMDTHGDADRSIGLPGQLALLVTISADC